MKRIACLLVVALVLAAAFPVAIAAESDSREAAYDEAVEALENSPEDPEALGEIAGTFDDMGGFRKSKGYAQYALALIEISKGSFDGAVNRLKVLKETNFSDTLLVTQLPALDALISYAQARGYEGQGRYYEAYQAYKGIDVFDSLSRAVNIPTNLEDSLYDEASGYEAAGDLARAAEVFAVIGGYSDSEERLSRITAQLSGSEAGQIESGREMYVVNCYSYVSLREWPSTSAPALARISRLDTVEFVEVYDGSFFRVRYQGVEGYVLSYYLSRDPQNAPGPTPAPVVNVTARDYPANTTLYVVNCAESISLRVSPDTGAAAAYQIPLGVPVTYKGSTSNGFYKIVYHGHTGYALASYLSDSSWGGGGSYGYDYGDTLTVVNCEDHISLRTRPDPQASRVTTIPLYADVTYLGPAASGFCEVEYDGYSGYALLSYLTRD